MKERGKRIKYVFKYVSNKIVMALEKKRINSYL